MRWPRAAANRSCRAAGSFECEAHRTTSSASWSSDVAQIDKATINSVTASGEGTGSLSLSPSALEKMRRSTCNPSLLRWTAS